MSGDDKGCSTDDNELTQKIKETGLDANHWLDVIKETLNISNIQSIQYIKPEDCLKLEGKTRHSWEKEALHKLFNIQEKNTIIEEMQKKHCKAEEEKNEQALKIIGELKQIRDKGKDRNDERVKQKEAELCKALDIPATCTVPPEMSLVDLIDYYEKKSNIMVEALKKNDNIKDEDILKYASGGLALEGIFQTQNIDDVFMKREPLLCIPKGLQLLGPEQSPIFEQKEFTSKKQESFFQKTVEKVGLGSSSLVNVGFMGYGLKISGDVSKESDSDITSKETSQQNYVCTTRYNYIPLASFFFTKDQLRLTQTALIELKGIEKLLAIQSDEHAVRMKCIEFFKRFGSHANLGPIHFGGIFWWKASMEGITSDQVQEAKRMTSEELNTFSGGSYAGKSGDLDISGSRVKGSTEKTTISKFQKDIQFFSTKTGGPSEVDSLLPWKSGLITSNKTWSVIDRGLQLMPVWEIIVSNHRDEFTDVVKLASCLTDSYTLSTGLTAKIIVGDNLTATLEKTKIFLQEVKSWKAEDGEEHLKTLIDFKQSLCETTNSYTTWVNICLSDKGLQEFLVNVVKKYQESSQKDLYVIKIILQDLLDTHVYSVDDFPEASFIMRWIYDSEKDEGDKTQVSGFKELLDVLNKSKKKVSQITMSLISSSEEQCQAQIQATQHIGLAIYSYLKAMKHIKHKDIELLILLLANNSGYCLQNHLFRNILGWKDIEFLKNNMEEAYNEYTNLRSQCVERAQAFVLYTGLTSAGEHKEMSVQQKADRLNYMKSHLEGYILDNVNKIIEQQSEWSTISDHLRAFAYGIEVKKKLRSEEFFKELEMICQSKVTYISADEQTAADDHSNADSDFLLLLERLHLAKYYPQKMKTGDFCKIVRSSISASQGIGEKQLSFYYLQKLLMLDYRARYIKCKTDIDLCKKNTITNNKVVNDMGDDVDDFLDDCDEKLEEHIGSNEPSIHPMDVQMAIFYCANDFMRQYLYTKLSTCQFALPLLIPNSSSRCIEFPLWSFQEIKKKWKTKSKDREEDKSNEGFITEAETSIVSFIRFGQSEFSKSQIINRLMSKQRHDIFYHRHCKGSTEKPLLMNGIAEIAWYCPGGKEDDAFDDCIAFTNLHGDARDLDEQVQFLEQISSVIVVLFTDLDAREEKGKKLLQQLLRSSKPLICLIADRQYTPPKPGLKLKIGLKDRNEADSVDRIADAIQSLMTSSQQKWSLHKCASIARSQGFIVDVDNKKCKQGRDEAKRLLSLLKEKPVSSMKEDFLPLQGELWHMWCKKDKELTRLKNKSNMSIEQHRSDILSQKRALRNKQLEKAFLLNNFMRSFLEILNSNDQNSKLYFLQWFKMFLDDLSSETLSALYKQYHNVWTDLKVEKQKGKNKNVLQKVEDKLEQLSTRINFSTFGLEHILRELGQIYESLETFPEKDKSFFTLPKIAAELMVSGYPVELMDGDAAHVPLKWVGAVLDELIGILGDKKVYVLSVLGIQSTGKSTLLNAMFGLRFAVSAGRCTRGAFMQLIKVDEELKDELHFEYLLVIDTEGLRAVELSNKNLVNHDNELSTFVLGLGNITVINIFGENPSEMQDILQIAVQAFLRMKQVNLKPSCLFVHQNVGEITAKEKNMEGRRKLQERLDEMTLCAAQQEQCDVTCFNDVIQFDVNTHIYYFAHLWEGDPPMAPPNPSYCENIQELKKIILLTGKQEKECNIMSFSMFKARVNDLWKALLNENFVFSFKNSLEIAAYKKLETKYNDWTWSLREHMLTLQNKVNNQIHNNVIESVDDVFFTEQFEEKFKNIQEDLNTFFTEEKDSELLVQWRANAEKRLATVKDDLITEVKTKAEESLKTKKNSEKINIFKDKYEDNMFKKSKHLALTLEGKNLNDEELEDQFNDMWNALINEVTRTVQLPQPPKINRDLENVFLERFKSETNIASTIRESYSWEVFSTAFLNYIQAKKKYGLLFEELKYDIKNDIEQTTKALQRRVDEYIDQKEQQKTDYQSVYFHEILNMLNIEIKNMPENKLKCRHEYKFYVSLFLCQKAAKRFKQISDAFQSANNPLVYLNGKKDEYCQSFKISCKKSKDTASLAELLCNTLKGSIQQEVTKRAAIQLASDIKNNDPSLNGNRSKLELCLLKSLAEKERFKDYITYIKDPKSAIQDFISECVDKYCSEKAKISDILNIKVDYFRQLISKAIERATAEVTDKCGDVKSWIEIFCRWLKNDMQLSSKDLKSVEYQSISDIGFLKEAMTKALQIVVKNLKEELLVLHLKELKKNTSLMLFDQFPGCWRSCPFCGAVCTETTSTHDGCHSMKFHRPRGLGGSKWNNTNHLCTDICTSLVTSDIVCAEVGGRCFKYKKYKYAGPPYDEWSITPDNSDLPYWKWVTCRFQSDFEEYYNLKFEGRGAIPSQWRNIQKQEAIRELEKDM